MAIMVACVGALSAFYHDSTDISGRQAAHDREPAHDRQMPTLAAMAYKYSIGQPFVLSEERSSNHVELSADVLRGAVRRVLGQPIFARALDRIFILHADHEQNASTSTVRLAGSSGPTRSPVFAAGIACLCGPAHGGANEAA